MLIKYLQSPPNQLYFVPAITYKLVFHKNESRILVQFEANDAWNKRMKRIPGVKWSKTHKGWTIPDTPGNRKKCGITGKASYEVSVTMQPGTSSKKALINISSGNQAEMKNFLQQLKLRAYSASTITTYRNEFAQLLQAIGKYSVKNP